LWAVHLTPFTTAAFTYQPSRANVLIITLSEYHLATAS
jgi:hypothetical protein